MPAAYRTRAQRGFTILELALVLALVSLVAMLAIPSFFKRTDVTLENAAVLLAQDLRSAQNRAAVRNVSMALIFDEGGAAYRCAEVGPNGEPRHAAVFERSYGSDAVFEGVVIAGVEAAPGRAIVYDRNGAPVQSAAIRLEFEGDWRLVHVHFGTGLISIEGSTSDWLDDGL